MAEEYTCSLSEASLKVAMEELGENPKERLGQVETFRTWILQQKHLKAPTDTEFLLKYLRTAKYSQLRAREILENSLKAKTKYPEWLDDIDMADPKMQEFMATGYMTCLPKRDPKGRVLLMADPGRLDLKKNWDKNVIVKAIFGITHYNNMNENKLVNGVMFFQDLTHFSMKLMTFWGLDTAKKTTKLFQGHFPGRFKGVHYYNTGPVFETTIGALKPLLRKKFIDRMHIYGKNMEDVYKEIPMEYFPTEYLPDDYTGPSQGSMQSIVDNFCAELRSPKVRDRILYETSSQWKYDFTLKPDDVPNESFRKLNVD